MKKKSFYRYGKLAFVLFLGNLLIALDVVVFIEPTGVIMGGSTGIALALHHFFGLNTATGVLIMNILFLALGSLAKGKPFFFASVASSVLYPALLALVQRLPLQALVVHDQLLASIMGGVILGAGVGLVIRNGASTGGTDNLAVALNHWTHIPTALLLTVADISILFLQAVFSNFEQILYGIVLTVISSFVLNQVIIMGQAQLQLFIISELHQEIRQQILHNLRIGATMVKIETGIAAKTQDGLLTVIHPRSLHQVTTLIQQIDPDAFITIVQAKEVRGRGFTKERIYYTEDGG